MADSSEKHGTSEGTESPEDKLTAEISEQEAEEDSSLLDAALGEVGDVGDVGDDQDSALNLLDDGGDGVQIEDPVRNAC